MRQLALYPLLAALLSGCAYHAIEAGALATSIIFGSIDAEEGEQGEGEAGDSPKE